MLTGAREQSSLVAGMHSEAKHKPEKSNDDGCTLEAPKKLLQCWKQSHNANNDDALLNGTIVVQRMHVDIQSDPEENTWIGSMMR